MTHLLHYKFNEYVDDFFVDCECDYSICEEYEDILEYLCTKKFGNWSMTYTNMYGTPEYEYAKEIRQKWLDNTLDTWELYNDIDFKDWLHEKYHKRALAKVVQDYLNEYYESTFAYDNDYWIDDIIEDENDF